MARPNPTDRVLPCTHRYGHKWTSDVFRRERLCRRCGLTLPLTGHALARAERVRRIGKRDGWQCFYCRVPFGDEPVTEDHRVPRCAGGTLRWANVVLACPTCNNMKGERSEKELRLDPRFQQRRWWVERRFGADRTPEARAGVV